MKYDKFMLGLSMLACAFPVWATDWNVDIEKSALHFISIKKNTVAEVHQFRQFEGALSDEGELQLLIDLASVDTNIEIRDMRMKEHLFQTDKFATAKLSTHVDMDIIDKLKPGESTQTSLSAKLDLHGQQQDISLAVLVTRLSDTKLLVVSAQPFILNVADFDLVLGVEKLRDLAGLPGIALAVPVSFYVTLTASN